MAESIHVRGLVQGVGFRPFVWHLARRLGIRGRVWNDGDGVCIQAWGDAAALGHFRRQLREGPPPMARIDALESVSLEDADMPDAFVIVDSRSGPSWPAIAPDAAICPDCLRDILDPTDRHHHYPLTSCSHCGPRLSILRAMPFDRAHTSMADFAMCPACREEYADAADRRFHAQANACPTCGPATWLEDASGTRLDGSDAIAEAVRRIQMGQIVAIKGIGGVHLAVDAGDGAAVARLRARKRREAKPFALMARDVDMVAAHAEVDSLERQLLTGREAPIVLLDRRRGGEQLVDGVAPGQGRLGFMLPYTPLYAMLMAGLARPIVLSSGNRAEAPACTGNGEALRKLAGIADAWLLHEREIVHRLDDSVAAVAAGRVRLLRRARGYAPAPLPLPPGFEAAPSVLAMGGALKHTFCLLRGGQAVLSPHIGDLQDAETLSDCRQQLASYLTLFDFHPQAVATDMHPDYLSGGLAREQGLPLIEVQHHHAHIAAGMAEHGVPLHAPPVLGIALDGLGFGADGTLWGGEFLKTTYADFTRLACFQPVAMPGGGEREPWRHAYAQLHALGWDTVRDAFGGLDIVHFLEAKPLPVLRAMVERGLNSPLASSCGRLFDAAAAVLGICREHAAYEGQAAMALEALAAEAGSEQGVYPFQLADVGGLYHLDWGPMWEALLADIQHGEKTANVARRFHNSVIAAVADTAIMLCREEGLATVVLGGGAFQNRLLLEGMQAALQRAGLQVLAAERVPLNDGGLSLGQAAVAAARMLMLYNEGKGASHGRGQQRA